MPIYEYECMDCNHYLDELQKMSDEPLKDCPKCHKPKLKRLLSAPSFRLKGGGWYETDFKKENQRNICLLYTSPSPRDQRGSRMPSSA